MAAEAAERNPDKNKYKALADAAAAMAMAAVFSLLVFCVASRFVSYWTTAAKGKREERGEEGREGGKPSLLFPFLVFLQISSSAARKKSCQKQLVPSPTSCCFPSDLSKINSYTNSDKADNHGLRDLR